MSVPNTDSVSIDKIVWTKVFPFLHMMRGLRFAFRLRVLMLTMAVWALPLPGVGVDSRVDESGVVSFRDSLSGAPLRTFGSALPPVIRTVAVYHPVYDLFLNSKRPVPISRYLVDLILVAFFAVAVARTTTQDFCRGMRCGPVRSAIHAFRKLRAIVVATAISGTLVVLTTLPLMFSNWLAGVLPESVSPWLGWFWAPAMMVSTLTSIVVFAGWMLAMMAVGTDGCGGADALSRGISYVLSHKLLTTGYFLIALFVGVATRLLAESLSMTCFDNAVKAGLSSPRLALLDGGLSSGGLLLLRVFPVAVQIGGFVSSMAVAYVLLRHREDGVNLDEVGGSGLAKDAS